MVKVNGCEIILKIGDITEEDVQAVVNAANSTLMGGGGVDGAIHSKGGPQILKECKKIREEIYPDGLPAGEAVITTGGKLKAEYVVHTVGPICGGRFGEREKKIMYNAYYNSLKVAKEKNIRTISFPSIGTGAYRCPVYQSAKTAIQAVVDFLKKEDHFEQVRFVLFSRDTYDLFEKALKEVVNA